MLYSVGGLTTPVFLTTIWGLAFINAVFNIKSDSLQKFKYCNQVNLFSEQVILSFHLWKQFIRVVFNCLIVTLWVANESDVSIIGTCGFYELGNMSLHFTVSLKRLLAALSSLKWTDTNVHGRLPTFVNLSVRTFAVTLLNYFWEQK